MLKTKFGSSLIDLAYHRKYLSIYRTIAEIFKKFILKFMFDRTHFRNLFLPFKGTLCRPRSWKKKSYLLVFRFRSNRSANPPARTQNPPSPQKQEKGASCSYDVRQSLFSRRDVKNDGNRRRCEKSAFDATKSASKLFFRHY